MIQRIIEAQENAREKTPQEKTASEEGYIISLYTWRNYPQDYRILWEYFFGPKLEKPVKRSFDETFAHVHAQLMTGNLPLRKHSEDMSGHYEVFVHLLQRLYAERWSGDSGVSCRELLDAAGPWRPDNTWGHSGFWRWSPQREAWNALVDREFPRAAKPE